MADRELSIKSNAQKLNAMTKAVAYYRRSTDKQETSLEQQREAVEAYAKQNGFEILKSYEDTGSGKSTQSRDGFLRMIEDSKNGRFKVALVYDISRFGRMDSDETGYYRHLLKENGVSVVFVAEGFRNDSSMGDRMVRSLKQEMAHEYIRDHAQKMIRGLIHHTERGFASGRIAPYGYRLMEVLPSGEPFMVRDEKGVLVPRVIRHELKQHKSEKTNSVKLTPDPIHRKVVERIFKMADACTGVRKITEILNREGVPSPGKFKRISDSTETVWETGKWGMHLVWTMLRNPLYKGTLVWNRSRNVFRDKFEWKRENGNIVVGEKRLRNADLQHQRSETEWVVCEKAHEAIIKPAFFDTLQTKLEKRKKNQIKKHEPHIKYLLTNLVHCGSCNEILRSEKEMVRAKIVQQNGYTVKRTERVYYYYRCTANRDKAICEKGLKTDMEIANQAVWSGVQARLNSHEVVKAVTQRVKRLAEERLGGKGLQLERVKAEKRIVTEKLNRLLDAVENGQMLGSIKARLREHETRLRELETQEVELVNFKIDFSVTESKVIARLRDLKRLAERGSERGRREVVQAFMKEAVADWKNKRLDVFYYQTPWLLGDFSDFNEKPSLAKFPINPSCSVPL